MAVPPFLDTEEYRAYCEDLRGRLAKIVEARGVGDRVIVIFGFFPAPQVGMMGA